MKYRSFQCITQAVKKKKKLANFFECDVYAGYKNESVTVINNCDFYVFNKGQM